MLTSALLAGALLTGNLLTGALLTPPPPRYGWLDGVSHAPASERLDVRFPTPKGYTRVAAPPDSYGDWLRKLPIRKDRREVLAYDGRPLSRPSIAVVLLDVGDRDLQQCADTVLRLHAEYLWFRGAEAKAAYHFTSGDKSAWLDWRNGERFRVAGAKVQRVRGPASKGRSHAAYRAWLTHLFRYAGTQSLRFDSEVVGERPLAAGDFFVQPGGPGHAVVALDVAEDASGRRIGLVAQGFMPAEDLHVLDPRGTDHVGEWFVLPNAASPKLVTPSWRPFDLKEARRFTRQP